MAVRTIAESCSSGGPADGSDLAALYLVHGEPEVLARDGPLLSVAAGVRAGIRESVASRAPESRALVPALVDGDDAGLSDRTRADFRTSGLTHLLAVSGTNLTLVVGSLLVLARWLQWLPPSGDGGSKPPVIAPAGFMSTKRGMA